MAKKLQVTAPTVEIKPQDEEDLLGINDPTPVQTEDYLGIGNEPYSATTQQFADLPVEVIQPTQPVVKKYVGGPISDIVEPALQIATGIPARLIGNIKGAIHHYGERGDAAEREAEAFAQKYTYEPRDVVAKQILPYFEEKLSQSKLEALPMFPELGAISQFAKPVIRQTKAPELYEQMKSAFPETKFTKEVSKVTAEDISQATRLKKASELPVPVELTAGQASQDPVLISRERNERGFKEQHAQRFNEQNKALQENANIIKQNAAPNVTTGDYVADADRLIDTVKSIKEANKVKTQEAYKALEEAAGGKFPIDGKKFANNAIEKLTSEDRLDYLPSTIKNKLDSYASGSKEMNFNLFENLRSDLAAEMRKADRDGDGNMKHVLSVVRDQLENLPMQEGDAVLKGLADNARKTAKADFDLEKSNPLYSKVLNESADSKDFIQNFVIRSKNADFMKSVDLLKNDPTALEHLRSGTMDYIIRESTDASGNFSTAKFQKNIENLNVNKKLDALFGEHSKQLQDLAEIAKIVEARPRGSFVNESNTATALGSMAKQYGGKVLQKIPLVGSFVEPAAELLQKRKIAKEVKESLNPKPKVKLSDIGK